MTVRFLSLATALLAGLSLAACSSEQEDEIGLDTLKGALFPKSEPVVENPDQVARAMTGALQSLEGPLALATFENTKNNVVLRRIATNGAYRTWAGLTAEDRRSVSTRNGVITATRGLTRDLMSSDVGQTLALVSRLRNGTAVRVQRYLDGENQIVAVTATCTIARGEATRVQVGEIDRAATEMVERCDDGERQYENLYRVDGSGRVLLSRQWLNEHYGSVVLQQLR